MSTERHIALQSISQWQQVWKYSLLFFVSEHRPRAQTLLELQWLHLSSAVLNTKDIGVSWGKLSSTTKITNCLIHCCLEIWLFHVNKHSWNQEFLMIYNAIYFVIPFSKCGWQTIKPKQAILKYFHKV